MPEDILPGTGLLARLIEFCEELRRHGIACGTSEALDAARALQQVDIADRGQFHVALRSTLVKRREHLQLFDELFERFWMKRWRQQEEGGEAPMERPRVVGAGRGTGPSGVSSALGSLLAYSPYEALGSKRFKALSAQEAKRLRRQIKRLAKLLSALPGRGYAASKRGLLDLRRTVRASLGMGGEVAALKRRRRKTGRARVVLLCDVSGSMDEHSERLLMLMHQFCNAIRAHVFAFSTRLQGLNPLLEGRSLEGAAELISERVRIWSSGTRIASALNELVSRYGGLLGQRTALIVVSDGLDLGEQRALDLALRRARSGVGLLLWLNPLADSPAYRPMTSTAEAILRNVDAFWGLSALWDDAKFRVLSRGLRLRHRPAEAKLLPA